MSEQNAWEKDCSLSSIDYHNNGLREMSCRFFFIHCMWSQMIRLLWWWCTTALRLKWKVFWPFFCVHSMIKTAHFEVKSPSKMSSFYCVKHKFLNISSTGTLNKKGRAKRVRNSLTMMKVFWGWSLVELRKIAINLFKKEWCVNSLKGLESRLKALYLGKETKCRQLGTWYFPKFKCFVTKVF